MDAKTLNFITKNQRITDKTSAVSITLRNYGKSEKAPVGMSRMGVFLSDKSWDDMGRPKYLICATDVTENHSRIYFKPSGSKEGFAVQTFERQATHVRTRGLQRINCEIPRISTVFLKKMVGDYDELKYSKTYECWYVERRNILYIHKS